jgi:hypothetical protein
LLNENSRLNPKVLKNRKNDSLKFKKKHLQDSLKPGTPPRDSIKKLKVPNQ